MVSLLTTLTVAAVVVASRKLWGTPKPLIATLLICLVICSLPFNLRSSEPRGSWLRSVAWLLVSWSTLSFGVLGGVYCIDRGGWLWFQVSGFNGAIAEDRSAELSLSPAEFVRRNPQFVLDPSDPTRIVVRRGRHEFSRTVVVPRGTALTIEAGTTICFGAGCSLISYSPINASGSAESPIAFLPRSSWLKWGVVGVVDAGSAVFQHVHFAHARQARVNDCDFPGGLSLVGTGGEIHHCRFQQMFGKDAVYVRGGTVSITHNHIERAFKDGIDSDGARGTISHNLIVDCEDEGIDLSDNQFIDVHDNTIRDRRGGRIAATSNLERIRGENTLDFLTGA